MDGFQLNLMLETFTKICQGTENLDKVGSRNWALYMKNPIIFIIAGERYASWKHFKKQYFDVFYGYV